MPTRCSIKGEKEKKKVERGIRRSCSSDDYIIAIGARKDRIVDT